VAMAAGMDIAALAALPFSFPTYAGVLARAAASAAYRLNRNTGWRSAALIDPRHMC